MSCILFFFFLPAGVSSSSNSPKLFFVYTCLDSSGQPFCIQCKPEYQGPNCEQCSDGFYNADSICLPCNCSGNGDPRLSPRICHPDTGHCLSCINNTTGPHCERCAEGFTGDALTRNCTRTGESQRLYIWANMRKNSSDDNGLIFAIGRDIGAVPNQSLIDISQVSFLFLLAKLQLYLKFFCVFIHIIFNNAIKDEDVTVKL